MKFSAIAVAMFAMATQSAFGQTVLVVRPPVKNVGASCTYRQVENWRGTVTDKYTETVTGAFSNGYQFSKITETGTTGLIVRNLDFNDIEHDGTKYAPHTGSYRYPMYQGQVYTVVYTYKTAADMVDAPTTSKSWVRRRLTPQPEGSLRSKLSIAVL